MNTRGERRVGREVEEEEERNEGGIEREREGESVKWVRESERDGRRRDCV